jgi:hypothetical protein
MQRIIELKKAKAAGVANKEITKVKSKADIEMNRDKLKANLALQKLELDFQLKKMEWEYKFKMAQLEFQSQQHQLSTTGTAPAPHHAAHTFSGLSSPDQQNAFSSGANQWMVSNAGSSNAPQPLQEHPSSSKPQSLTEELNSNKFDFGDVGKYGDIYK